MPKDSVNNQKTFPTIVIFVCNCFIWTMVLPLDLELFLLNVKAIALNGELNKEIYMDYLLTLKVKDKSTMCTT